VEKYQERSKAKPRDARGVDRAPAGDHGKQLAKFHTLRGKRFDCVAFAKAHKISLDWLIDGTLSLHPRIPAPRREKRSSQRATPTEMREFERLLGLLPESDRPWLSAKMRQLLDN
jgi:hypothetical protein